MDKRLVSISFKGPKSLEGNTIYIWLEKPGSAESIKASACSAVEFNYPCHAIAGNLLRETTTEATNQYGMRGNRYNYREFIEGIVENNNGEIDTYRAVEEGTNAFRAMREQIR